MHSITGLMIYYYFICTRKLWYFLNQIHMEENSELVALGKILDETSYQREKRGVLIDNTINIDFIEDLAVIHEVKKTKAIEEASIWQVKYYMYYLEQKGIKEIQAEIHYPLLKQKRQVILEPEDKKKIEEIIKEIKIIQKEEIPPCVINAKICKRCAYFDLCYV